MGAVSWFHLAIVQCGKVFRNCNIRHFAKGREGREPVACWAMHLRVALQSIRRQSMIQSIPLKKLAPSPRNVRKSSDVPADLQEHYDMAKWREEAKCPR